ncbi:MAG: Cu(I)/Ag(I) efflux system membrane fusion protein [Limisphaerales bacterium]|jgi:Cu(I)/Ag(I) efflux system membrane fusion protein
MKKQILITSILVVVALVAGFFLGYGRGIHAGHDPSPATDSAGGTKIKFWTCAMHPQIQQPKLGDCKLCGMDLIAVREGQNDNLGPRELKLSAAAAKLADIEITPVIRMIPEMNVRMVGKIEYDESRLAYITARFPGRLDRLFVDYTGVSVNEGDHLAMIYSPKLLVAQQELIQAKKNLAVLGNDAQSGFRERAHKTLLSAREKLRLWDLTPEQIQQIEQNEKPMDHLTINAPIGGVVLHKNAVEGVYLETGTRIYTIADLSSVWVKLDAYESDLQWLHYGQKVEFFTEALPGEKFSGRISFIDRVLNPKTRTVKIRVNIPNKDGRLKPDMFVRAVVKSRIATEGRVMDPFYAGKWISPMHPEIVSDKPGECTICGMALVPAESLGYAAATNATVAPLVIPASAPLITGNRAVVYVTATNRPGIYEGREITLGPRAGNYYLVKEGLKEGELVASSGTFKIDSAIQILAKPSMMNPTGGHNHGGGDHQMPDKMETSFSDSTPDKFKGQLAAASKAYVAIKNNLSSDKSPITEQLSGLKSALGTIDMSLVKGDAHMAWMMDHKLIQKGLTGLTNAKDLAASRIAFEHLSNGLIAAIKRFGSTEDSPVYVYHCPMAFGNRGANWLQDEKGTLNPYFGSRMLKCGELKQEIK